jgi:hypothetical protein
MIMVMKLFINKTATTAHNRTVYASPPVGGSAYGFARSFALLIPTQNLRHILSALQMLRICLSGRQTKRRRGGRGNRRQITRIGRGPSERLTGRFSGLSGRFEVRLRGILLGKRRGTATPSA